MLTLSESELFYWYHSRQTRGKSSVSSISNIQNRKNISIHKNISEPAD